MSRRLGVVDVPRRTLRLPSLYANSNSRLVLGLVEEPAMDLSDPKRRCYSRPMLQHNSYFDGLVQSIGFERLGRRQSVGVIDVGTHTFGTGAPERMTVVSGELLVSLEGMAERRHYSAGTAFEVPANSSFTVVAGAPCAYLCEYF